jgi:hypothetical protein
MAAHGRLRGDHFSVLTQRRAPKPIGQRLVVATPAQPVRIGPIVTATSSIRHPPTGGCHQHLNAMQD